MKVLQDVEIATMTKAEALMHVGGRLFIVVGVFVLAWMLSVILGQRVQTAPAPRFTPGETYLFVWDCLPQAMALPILLADGTTTTTNPCYVEKLTVRQTYEDGRLLVVDPDELAQLLVAGHPAEAVTLYWVNPDRAISINKVKAPAARRAVHFAAPPPPLSMDRPDGGGLLSILTHPHVGASRVALSPCDEPVLTP